MKKLFSFFAALLMAATMFAGRTFDGTEVLYLNAGAVSWWQDANAVQRASFDGGELVIGTPAADPSKVAFLVPAGTYETVVFSRAAAATGSAWNSTGAIALDGTTQNMVATFNQNSTDVTWGTYDGGGIDRPACPDALYAIGNIANVGWTPGSGIAFTKDGEVFTSEPIDFVAEGTNTVCYFCFTSTNSTDWAVVNANRYGTQATIVADAAGVALKYPGENNATIAPGTYVITVDWSTLTVSAEVVVVPSTSIKVNAANPIVAENFDGMAYPAADAALVTGKNGAYGENYELPTAWRIERNQVGPRTIGTFSGASESAQYAGGVSLPSNASNGTWNLGTNGNSDRALGGMTTSVANGARTINVMTHLENNGTCDFESIHIAYDIEKYREGSNANLFYVKLFTSTDGIAWTAAGADFTWMNPAGSGQTGFATVPGFTQHVEGDLVYNFAAGAHLYLCWSISTSAGENCASAPCLAIDNVNIEFVRGTTTFYLWDTTDSRTHFYMYGGTDGEAQAWPGLALADFAEVAYTSYGHNVYKMTIDNGAHASVIFNNGSSQSADLTITADQCFNNTEWNVLPSATRSGLTAGDLGTICLPFEANVHESSAVVYKIAGRRGTAEAPTSIVLEEVSVLEAGLPYIFEAQGDEAIFDIRDANFITAGSENGLVGSITGTAVAEGMYVIAGNTAAKCGTGCSIAANRAYIDMNAVPEYDEAAAPARVIGISNVATAVENMSVVLPAKVMRNGQIYLMRDGVIYDVIGRMVR